MHTWQVLPSTCVTSWLKVYSSSPNASKPVIEHVTACTPDHIVSHLSWVSIINTQCCLLWFIFANKSYPFLQKSSIHIWHYKQMCSFLTTHENMKDILCHKKFFGSLYSTRKINKKRLIKKRCKWYTKNAQSAIFHSIFSPTVSMLSKEQQSVQTD